MLLPIVFLEFIELGATAEVTPVALPAEDEGSSTAVPVPEGFPFGGITQTVLHVSSRQTLLNASVHVLFGYTCTYNPQVITNGFLIFGVPDIDSSPSLFPSELSFAVAPFWADVDISNGVGEIRYEVHNASSDPVIAEVSAFVSQQQQTVFQGEWLLVAEWRDVPEFGENTSLVSGFLGCC